MKRMRYLLFICLIVSLASCSTVKVHHEYDSGTDFTVYTSYDWLPVPKRNIKYSHITEKIKFIMKKQLESKGYVQVSDGPDLMIALHGEHHGFLSYEDYVFLRDHYEPYLVRRIQDLSQYDGKLIVDFIDTGTREIVYRARADAYISDTTPERLDQSIQEAVTEIINNFPPGS